MKKIILLLLLILTAATWTVTAAEIAGSANPLPADSVFQFSAAAKDYQTILTKFDIQPGYYLYRDRIHVSLEKDVKTNNQLAAPILPLGIQKHDLDLGNYQVYTGRILIPYGILQNKTGPVTVNVKYQGCSEAGFCYPPVTKAVQVNMSGPYNIFKSGIDVDLTTGQPLVDSQSPTSKVSDLLAKSSIFYIILGFLGFGLLLAFTPCVLPMIPILSGIIVGQKEQNLFRDTVISLSYVLGMALTYAIAGIIFGYLGANIQTVFQKPWLIILFTFFFVAMAASMFGLFELKLPDSITHKLHHASNKQKGGTFIGAFIMGIIATLIVSPCVTPPLVGVLGYISSTGNSTLGGIALFSMGIGMGIPLIIIGVFGGKFLPKAGHWMNAIKNVIGVLLLFVAAEMLGRIVPDFITLILWGAIIIGVAVYLWKFLKVSSSWKIFWRIFSILIFIYGTVLVVGGFLRNNNPLHPLANMSHDAQQSKLHFTKIKSLQDLHLKLNTARKQGKIVMLDFSADWCLSCKIMDRTTFHNKDVKNFLSDVTILRADVTANDAVDKALLKQYDVIAPPTLLFFGIDGKEIRSARIVGEISSKAFIKHLSPYIKP